MSKKRAEDFEDEEEEEEEQEFDESGGRTNCFSVNKN
jgi:hypothetical protein